MTPAEFIDNPNWAGFIPDMREAAKTRHLPTHEDCARLDVEAATMHLRTGGTLGAMPGYEERPGQIDMSGAIARAFNAREHLMIEAGTGVGKSLAYLVPSILWAWTNDTPVIVSTATRNLQFQLISSDIPKALKVLDLRTSDARPKTSEFKVALLKGRGNYLCLRAVADFFAPGFWTMSADEQALMPAFIDWLQHTPDGDLDGYEGLPRNLLACPGEECSGRRCPFYAKCFVYKARKAAAEAHLVVVNHALVLAEATAPGSGILPGYGRLVLDEAHNLEDIATEYLSYELSLPALTRILNRLARRGKGKRSRPGGVLASIERQFQKGAFAGNPAGEKVMRLLGEASRLTVKIVNAAEDLFEVAALLLRPAKDRGVCRYRVGLGSDRVGLGSDRVEVGSDRVEVGSDRVGTLEDSSCRTLGDVRRLYSLHGLFKPYEPDEWDEGHFRQAQADFEAQLAAMVNLLHDLRDTLDGAVPEGELNYLGDLSAQVAGVADSLVGFANEANFVICGEKDTHAYWVERVGIRSEWRSGVLTASGMRDAGRGMSGEAASSPLQGRVNRRPYLRLVAAPLSVAEDLKRMFYDVKDSVILCSATLRVGNDFRYMARRLGCGERFQMLTAASPFDYFRQALVLAPDCLPDPAANPVEYASSLALLMRDLFSVTHGRALVLFTSYEMMNAVAAHAHQLLADAGITLLVQGEGLSRESMTRILRESISPSAYSGCEAVRTPLLHSSPIPHPSSPIPHPSSPIPHPSIVLFGSQSFWEGVDVAGEALSCVVLARLPFAQVGDPVVEARSEKIDREGGSSFRDYALPEAVIKFRQGFGRLVRTKSDRGVVVVTDPRLVTKNYGATFRKSIPATVHTVTDPTELLERVAAFF